MRTLSEETAVDMPDKPGFWRDRAGDLLLADITTTNRITRLHAWANSRHTLTKLFADPGNPAMIYALTSVRFCPYIL